MGVSPVDEPEGRFSLSKQKSNACHDIMEGDEYLLISSSEGEFGISRHIDPKNYAKYIGLLEVAKSELLKTIHEAARADD